ncbi:hypothetical protein ACFP1I_09445 [Dyadobacter subterraneus]|uniref:Uncharacterized protein n=1 Tax=Dyadobacter subterraneus TaxID=2773304 RepID=A0ABR9WB10_9BACT|nr:hypothetical protein [Dyadobacter subterraneus]MBE9462674.1 hypothetical protein [Dyadobacter subterraneus]
MKESIKIIPAKNKVVIRIFRQQPAAGSRLSCDVHFELRSLCDIPILIFKLSHGGEVIAVPVHFKKISTWPDLQTLPLHLQFFDLNEEVVFFEKQILLSRQETASITENRSEQLKMKSRQIDAIADFIYSDYVGFAQLAESL